MRSLALVAAFVLLGCPSGRQIFDCSAEDCESCTVLAEKLSWTEDDQTLCATCQGADAGTANECFNAPTVEGKHLIRGCNVDSDCAGLSNFCSRHASGPRNTCVVSDPL